jgi:rhodanese-related sulfurtransferase
MDPIPEISHYNLMNALCAGSATVIDVNGTASYESLHIPTAIDFEAKSSVLVDLLPADHAALIVVYCGGPSCSAYLRAARAVETLGYTNIRHYADGISGWKAATTEAVLLMAP